MLARELGLGSHWLREMSGNFFFGAQFRTLRTKQQDEIRGTIARRKKEQSILLSPDIFFKGNLAADAYLLRLIRALLLP